MPGGGEPRWHPRPPRPSHSPGGFSGDAGLGDRLLARGPEVLGRLEGGVSAGGGGRGARVRHGPCGGVSGVALGSLQGLWL